MSRAELARRFGTSQAYVTHVLRGNVNFTFATLVKLARVVEAQVRLVLCQSAVRSARPAEHEAGPVARAKG